MIETPAVDWQAKLSELQQVSANAIFSASLAMVWEKTLARQLNYKVKYVDVSEDLEEKLIEVTTSCINGMQEIEEFALDSDAPDAMNVWGIESSATNFRLIKNALDQAIPEEDMVESYDELKKAFAYLIVVRIDGNIRWVGFKKVPENWASKKKSSLLNIFYDDTRLELIDDGGIFSISKHLGLVFHDDNLFVVNREELEIGLKYRERIILIATNFYSEVGQLDLFSNGHLLSQRIQRNTKLLKKIAMIQNLGHYSNPQFMQRLKAISAQKQWGMDFDGDKIVLSEHNIDAVLTVLQNKRLFSELTEETFDVGSATKLI